MCGILGVLFSNRKNPLLRSMQITNAMEVLKPRGPDESHVMNFDHVAIGHTRLSIVNPHSGPPAPCWLSNSQSRGVCSLYGHTHLPSLPVSGTSKSKDNLPMTRRCLRH